MKPPTAKLPPNYRQTTANVVNRQTANRLYVKAVVAVVVVVVTTASKESDRKGFTMFRFASAEYAEFQTPI